MKIDIPERLYFKILRGSEDLGITPNELVESIFQRHLDLENSYVGYSNDDIEFFKHSLHNTIDEIMQTQFDMAEDKEALEYDKAIIPVLNIIFKRCTRDRFLVEEMLEAFYKIYTR